MRRGVSNSKRRRRAGREEQGRLYAHTEGHSLTHSRRRLHKIKKVTAVFLKGWSAEGTPETW